MRTRKLKEELLRPENLKLTGTPIYASIYSHLGTTQWYMKDDVESLTYMLIHLGRGRLPWLYVDVKPGDNYINIFNWKRNIDSRDLVGSLNPGFIKLVDYARGLDALETPNYDYMKQIFYDMMDENSQNNYLVVTDINNIQIDTQNMNGFFSRAKSNNFGTK